MTGGKTDRGLEEEKKRGVIVSRTVEWRRREEKRFRQPIGEPSTGWLEDCQEEEEKSAIDFFGRRRYGLCGRFFSGVEEEEESDDVCVSERRKRRGFLLKQTSRLGDGAGMREKLRSGILVRAVGLFCSATATGPTGGEQANDMLKAWPASDRRKGEGHAYLHFHS